MDEARIRQCAMRGGTIGISGTTNASTYCGEDMMKKMKSGCIEESQGVLGARQNQWLDLLRIWCKPYLWVINAQVV